MGGHDRCSRALCSTRLCESANQWLTRKVTTHTQSAPLTRGRARIRRWAQTAAQTPLPLLRPGALPGLRSVHRAYVSTVGRLQVGVLHMWVVLPMCVLHNHYT